MKKSFVVVVLAISIAVCSVATASVYFMMEARMAIFSGRVEQPVEAGEKKLLLKVNDNDDGQKYASIASYGRDCFPILTDVEGHIEEEKGVWRSRDGRSPLAASSFVLTAEGGDLEDIVFRVEGSGDATFSSAVRFGITINYHGSEDDRVITRLEGCRFDLGSEKNAHSSAILLGDGTIAEGEEVTISIVVWIDKDALERIGDYGDGILNIEVVFYQNDYADVG